MCDRRRTRWRDLGRVSRTSRRPYPGSPTWLERLRLRSFVLFSTDKKNFRRADPGRKSQLQPPWRSFPKICFVVDRSDVASFAAKNRELKTGINLLRPTHSDSERLPYLP